MAELNVNPTNEEICEAVWKEYGSDNIRFHSSGYHGIDNDNKVSLPSFIEESAAELDFGGPQDIGLQMDAGEFQRIMSGQNMVAAYCKFKYNKLKQFNGFDFPEQENWQETIVTTEWY